MASNIRMVQQLYDGFNARDIDAVPAALAEDVVWANGTDGGHVHGREAVRTYWTQQWSAIDPHADPMRITEAEDGSTTVEVHQMVHDLGGKLLLDEAVRDVFRITSGHVTRFDIGNPGWLLSIAHAAS